MAIRCAQCVGKGDSSSRVKRSFEKYGFRKGDGDSMEAEEVDLEFSANSTNARQNLSIISI